MKRSNKHISPHFRPVRGSNQPQKIAEMVDSPITNRGDFPRQSVKVHQREQAQMIGLRISGRFR